jgi:hypothetical protein
MHLYLDCVKTLSEHIWLLLHALAEQTKVSSLTLMTALALLCLNFIREIAKTTKVTKEIIMIAAMVMMKMMTTVEAETEDPELELLLYLKVGLVTATTPHGAKRSGPTKTPPCQVEVARLIQENKDAAIGRQTPDPLQRVG